MKLFEQLLIAENQKRAAREVAHAINMINETYNEWKKIKRRRNAVNIVTTCVNKLANINPSVLDHVHDVAKLKLATVIMRCLDVPPWMDADSKRITYRRLYPLIEKVQSVDPNTGTGGRLRDVIMTRLSASVCYNCGDDAKKKVFVAYEPSIKKSYLRFIFGDDAPEHVCKMQSLSLPKDFDTLLDILKINHSKACDKYLQTSEE